MAKPLEIDEYLAERIIQSVNGLEYGTVQIVVHDGRIVQIERTERRRFEGDSVQAKKSGAKPEAKVSSKTKSSVKDIKDIKEIKDIL